MTNASPALACEAVTGGGGLNSQGWRDSGAPAGFQREIDAVFTDAARIETRASRLLAKARKLSEKIG